MIGKYEIEIYNNKVHYFLTVKRNVTLLQGDSATGKSELLRLIQDREENGASSGITLICDAKCTVLTAVDWELRLKSMRRHIVFIDETANFLKTARFAGMVRGSDNYFVIICRDALNQLPYSIEEIYGLRNASNTQKYRPYKKVYNEMYRLYNLRLNAKIIPDTVITEDSNAGYELYKEIYPQKCISAGGKTRIYEMIRSHVGETVVVIVDGAAFGPEIGRIISYLESVENKCVIYAPESFEYILLCSNIFDVPEEIVSETYLFADSVKYMSWEEFYTACLTDITRNTVYQYGKTRLNSAYRTQGVIRKVIAVLPEQIRPE